jgi:hypothetical protein
VVVKLEFKMKSPGPRGLSVPIKGKGMVNGRERKVVFFRFFFFLVEWYWGLNSGPHAC